MRARSFAGPFAVVVSAAAVLFMCLFLINILTHKKSGGGGTHNAKICETETRLLDEIESSPPRCRYLLTGTEALLCV